MTADFCRAGQIHVGKKQLLRIVRQGKKAAVGGGHESLPTKIHVSLQTDPIAHNQVYAVLESGNADFPAEDFRRLKLFVGDRNENQLRPLAHAGPIALRKMAVIADDQADFPDGCVDDLESVVPGRKVVLFIKMFGPGTLSET